MSKDWFREAFATSVADVRQRLVEEAWFGRTVTPRQPHGRDGHSLSEQFGWDRVLQEKTFPDRAAESAHLQSLEAGALRKQRPAAPDHDIER